MSEWRPEGWEDPYEGMECKLVHTGPLEDRPWCLCNVRLVYEAGADAMLAALRKVGTTGEFYFNKIGEIKCSGAYANDDTPLSLFREGTVIFIPDEKV